MALGALIRNFFSENKSSAKEILLQNLKPKTLNRHDFENYFIGTLLTIFLTMLLFKVFSLI